MYHLIECCVAEMDGFEPSLQDPKSRVLPLDDISTNTLIIAQQAPYVKLCDKISFTFRQTVYPSVRHFGNVRNILYVFRHFGSVRL